MTPDVNVLVAASRSDHPHHDVARDWLDETIAGAQRGATLCLMPMVIASVLRLVTSPRIFGQPTPIEHAVAFIEAILSRPGVHLAATGMEWPRLKALCLEQRLSGNDLPDAWLAAAVEHHSEHLVSFDRDFMRLLPRASFTLLTA